MNDSANPTLLTILMVVALGMVVVLGGCGQQQAGPSVDELVQRRQRREMAQLSQAQTPEQRLQAAGVYLEQGNPVAARRHLRPLLVAQPDHPEAILLSARIEATAGDRPAAIEMLGAVDPSHTEVHRQSLWLASQWLLDEERYRAAESKLRRMLHLYGDSDRVHRELARMLNNQGRRIEAARHLRALARSGAIREKELFAMNTYSDPFIDESAPKPDFSGELTPAALAEAKRLHAEGELARAAEWIDRLRSRFPDSTPIAAFQGRVYSDLHDEQRLRDWLRGLPEGIEREPEYWHVLGKWLQRQGRHRHAVRCLAEAVTRDPTDRFAYLALARSLETLGRETAAGRARQRYEWLAEAARIARGIGLAPPSAADLNRMADLLGQLGRPWEAVSWREIAVRIGGGDDQQQRALRQRRRTLAGRRADRGRDLAATCGLELSQWPLPSAEMLGSESPGAESSGAVARRDRPSEQNDAPLVLEDVAADARLAFQYDNGDDPTDDSRMLHQMTGGGVAVIDLDLDGWPDLYFTQGGGDAFDPHGSKPNRLFRNFEGVRFADITSTARVGDRGYGQGAAVADLNQDGFPDLVVANIGPNVLYLNNGDGTFSARPAAAAGHPARWTTTVACGDLSGDHLPEIVEVNYVDDPSAMTIACTPERDICNPSVFQPAADRVWSLGAHGGWQRWNGCRQMADQVSYGFAAVIANFDETAGNDLFIANDTTENHYWVSQPVAGEDAAASAGWSLVESAPIRGCASGLLGQRQGCMGVAHGDFDGNGWIDLHVTNYWNQPADLYMQQPGGFFVNENAKRGIYAESSATVGWGTQSVDLDRDGWPDLAVLNGHLTDHRHRGQPLQMRPQLFRGGADGFQFVAPSAVTGEYWSRPALGRTMAVLDWNGDRQPDLVTNHLDVPAALLENRTEGGSSIRLELVGTESERDATGAKVTVRCGEQRWTGWSAGGDGFLCSNEPVLDFGIGAAERVDSVEVRWPSGTVQRFTDLASNRTYMLVEGSSAAFVRQ